MKDIRAICLFLSILVFWFTAGCAKGSGGNEGCGDGVCQISESETTCPQDCAQAGCGNGRIDDGEECDGSDLGGATCASIGYTSGSLGCTTSCRYNTSFCRSSCSDVCSDGQTRCNGNTLETCAADAQGCRIWANPLDCTTQGQICDDASGTAACADSCSNACTEGDRRCSLNLLQLCQRGENGCTQWKDDQNCALTNWVCTGSGDSAACTDPCNHECAAGSPPSCSGDVVQTCTTDAQGCRIWLAGENCAASGRICSGGACTCIHACSIGESRCSGTIRQTCTTNAQGCRIWTDAQNCASSGQVCDTSSGSAQCVNTCTSTCSNGAVRCLGDILQNCQLAGSGCYDWADTINCAASGRSCSGSTCVCNNECSAGQVRCSGNVTQSCQQDAYGCLHWVNGTDCAALGQTCSAGSCQAPASPYSCTPFSGTYSSIRTTGTPLTTDTYYDDNRYSFTIPFTFYYFGIGYTSGYLCTNGWISFGPDPGANTYSNTVLPDAGLPNNAIYPFWDDLVYSQSDWPDSRLLYQTLGSAPNRVFVLEWHQVRYIGTSTDHRASFQVRLYESSNAFEVIYDRATWLGSSWSATVGFENADASIGVDIGATLSAPPADNYRCTPN